MPQVLKRLDAYLNKHGLEITAPYDRIRLLDQGSVPCVLCNEVIEDRIYIPNVTCIESGVTVDRVICANLAQCHKRCKDNEAKKKAAFKAKLKAIEEQIVFPEWFGGI
jgi:hypothetical protein